MASPRKLAHFRARHIANPLIWIRLPFADKAAIRRAAVAAGLTISEFVRNRLADVCQPTPTIGRDFQPAAPAAGRFTSTDPNWLETREAKRRANSVEHRAKSLARCVARLNEAAAGDSLAPAHRKLVDRPPEE